jgi:hypothetical protein
MSIMARAVKASGWLDAPSPAAMAEMLVEPVAPKARAMP